jgi:hypothetical protein
MAAALELTPTLGAGAACRAMGLGRGEPARQRARVHRRTVIGPPRPRAPRPCPPLALDANERRTGRLADTRCTEDIVLVQDIGSSDIENARYNLAQAGMDRQHAD